MSEPDDAQPEPLSAASEGAQRCPDCGAELPSGAVLCVTCGYHLKEGRRLETVRAPGPAESAPLEEPPYLPPDVSLSAPVRKKELEKNLDLETRMFWLEERVRELEKRVRGTQLTAPDFATRIFAVFAHWLFAFLAIAFCLGSIFALFYILSLRF